ncbi:MAG TPA: hypothetical protein VH165_33245 [Kofleriaceae bacterium]|jgi:hypothetical protein|nr:hypothetical protein [Kofleriaceae bacterium]
MLPRWNGSALLAACTLAACAALVACGSGDDGIAPKKDAGIDTGPPPPDTLCGNDTAYTGEIVDWDSTAANFCGVFKATVTVRGDTTRTSMTNPNGRFQLCLAHQAETVLEVTPPADASQCASMPGTYMKSGIIILEQSVVDAGALASARLITETRRATMFSGGLTYSAGQAQIVVHIVGTSHPVTYSSGNVSTFQQFNGTAWSAVAGQTPTTGNDVLLPGADVSGGAVTVTVTGATPATVMLTTTPAATATLAPDKFTYITVAGS